MRSTRSISALLLLSPLIPACMGGRVEPCDRYHWDADGDGYPVLAWTCDPPEGATLGVPDGELDCNDESEIIYPDASDGDEGCDQVDNDCDGDVDEHETEVTWYADADGDGYGDAGAEIVQSSCDPEPQGAVAEAGDCDDADAETYPGAAERCSDGIVQDCEGEDAICALFQDKTVEELGAVPFSGGTSVAALGDINGDELADFAVGFAGADKVVIYSVGDDGVTDGTTLTGTTGSAFGASLAAGDFDGDGAVDLAVGAPEGGTMSDDSTYPGMVSVFPGPEWLAADVTTIDTHYQAIDLGLTMCGVPGADHDGLFFPATYYSSDEIYTDLKAVYVADPMTAATTSAGTRLGPYIVGSYALAFSAVSVGTETWLAVGFSGGTSLTGPGVAIYDASGSSMLTLTDGSSSTSALGASVAVGNVDGTSVVLAGAPGAGAVYLLSDLANLSEPEISSYNIGDLPDGSLSWTASGEESNAGSAVALVGDVELDDDGELAIGGSGKLWLVAYGARSFPEGDLDADGNDRIVSGTITGFAGYVTQVVNAGDVNGDTYEDLLVVDESSVWLLYGGVAQDEAGDSGDTGDGG